MFTQNYNFDHLPSTISLGIKHSPLKYWVFSQKNHFNEMLFQHVVKHYSIQVGNNQDLGVAEDWILGGKHHSQPDARLLSFNSLLMVDIVQFFNFKLSDSIFYGQSV